MISLQEENDLIDQLLAGKQEPYSRLIDLYKSYAFTIALKVLNNRPEAEEAAQDAFIKAFHSLKSFNRQARFSTWLYRIVFNTAVSYKRKNRNVLSSIEHHDCAAEQESLLEENDKQLFVSAAMEVAKKLLVLYLGKVPTYSVIYGTFATVPILLVWIYLAWMIVLLGAVITAYLPSLRSGVVRHELGAGGRFQLALECLQFLHRARGTDGKGLTLSQLTRVLQVSHLGIELALEALVELDWVARLDDSADQVEARYVLLADPDTTRLEPLMQALLLRRTGSTEKVWRSARWGDVRLREVL